MNTELVERVARAIAAEAVLMFRAYLQGAGAGQQHMTHATTEMEKHLNKSIDAKLATLSPTPVKETEA